MIQTKSIYCQKDTFFLSQLLKDYKEASCSGASSEPIGHLDLSDLMSETETGNEEREFRDVANNVILDLFGWTFNANAVASVGKTIAYQRNLKTCFL